MKNAVPTHLGEALGEALAAKPAPTDGVAEAVADRVLAARRAHYAAEARRLIDAAFAVMRRTGRVDPAVRDVVAEAGLSNQAFYRHFPSKDALLLAVLADGRRQLVAYLSRRVRGVADPAIALRRWVDGVIEQARNPQAAAATRPFVAHAARLAAAFPDEVATGHAQLVATLEPVVAALGGDERDAQLVHDLVMRRMEDALLRDHVPTGDDVEHLVTFCLRGVGCLAEVRSGT